MSLVRSLARGIRLLAVIYLGACLAASAVVLTMAVLVPAQSKYLGVWLLMISVPWSDLAMSRLGPSLSALWFGTLGGFFLNAGSIWLVGRLVQWGAQASAMESGR